MLNYYRILGLEPDADTSEIRRAFRVLAKRHHPDEGGSVVEGGIRQADAFPGSGAEAKSA